MSAANKRYFDTEAVADTGAGEWLPLAQFIEASFHLIGMGAGDEVTVEVSNEETPSAGNAIAHSTQTGSNALIDLTDVNANWVRLSVTSDGANGSELDAWFYGFRRET